MNTKILKSFIAVQVLFVPVGQVFAVSDPPLEQQVVGGEEHDHVRLDELNHPSMLVEEPIDTSPSDDPTVKNDVYNGGEQSTSNLETTYPTEISSDHTSTSQLSEPSLEQTSQIVQPVQQQVAKPIAKVTSDFSHFDLKKRKWSQGIIRIKNNGEVDFKSVIKLKINTAAESFKKYLTEQEVNWDLSAAGNEVRFLISKSNINESLKRGTNVDSITFQDLVEGKEIPIHLLAKGESIEVGFHVGIGDLKEDLFFDLDVVFEIVEDEVGE